MRLGLETDIFANLFLLMVTIVYIFSPLIGFFLLLGYLLFSSIIGKMLHIIIPMIYLAINSALGGMIFFKGISHLQFLILATIIVLLLRKPGVLVYMMKWCVSTPAFLLAIVLLFICCLRTGSGLTIFLCLTLLLLIIIGVIAITNSIKSIFDAIIVAANQVFFLGIIEFLLQRTFFYSTWTGEERYRNGILRIGSTVSDPNYICLTLIPIALLCYYLFKVYKEKKYLGCFVAYYVLCILTMSRIGILGLLFVIYLIIRTYYFNKLKYIQKIFMNLIGVCLIFVLLSMILSMFVRTQDSRLLSSNFARTVTMQYGVKLFIDNAWNGLGLNQFYNYAQPLFYSQYGGHFAEGLTVMNMPLEIAIAYGIPGLIAFGLLIGNSLLRTKKCSDKELAATLAGMLLVFIGISLTLDGATSGQLWIITALPFGIYEIVRQKPKLKKRISSLS